MSKVKMTPWERSEYDRLRREQGYGAQVAWLHATRDRGGPDVPTDEGGTFERKGFILTVHLDSDDLTLQDCGPGYFTDNWTEGCLDRRKEGYSIDPQRGEYQYFLPDMTEAEHIKGGTTKEEAARYVRQDHDRAERFAEGDWNYQYVRVTAEREGVELGSAGIGSIETDCGERYLRQTIDEMADEAIGEAQKAVKALSAPAPIRQRG